MTGMILLFIVLAVIIFVLVIVVMDYLGREGTKGRPCSEGCKDPYICDEKTKTCRLKPGSRCRDDSDCTSNAVCSGSVCHINIVPIRPPAVPPQPGPSPLPAVIVPNPAPVPPSPTPTPSSSSCSISDSCSSGSTEESEEGSSTECGVTASAASLILTEDGNSSTSIDNYEDESRSSVISFQRKRASTEYRLDEIHVLRPGVVVVNSGSGRKRLVRCESTRVESFHNFAGRLFCLVDNRLNVVDPSTYSKDSWKLLEVGQGDNDTLTDIASIEVSESGSYMQLTDLEGKKYLYDTKLSIIS
jgi:hypothetical protein